MDGRTRAIYVYNRESVAVSRSAPRAKISPDAVLFGDRFLFSTSVSSMPVAVVRRAGVAAAPAARPGIYSGASPNRSRAFSYFFSSFDFSASARAAPPLPPTVFKVKFVSSFIARAASAGLLLQLSLARAHRAAFFLAIFPAAAVACCRRAECTCSLGG